MLNANLFLPLKLSTVYAATIHPNIQENKQISSSKKQNEKRIKQKWKERKINRNMCECECECVCECECSLETICDYRMASFVWLKNECQIWFCDIIYRELNLCYESHKHWTASDTDLFVVCGSWVWERERCANALWRMGPNGSSTICWEGSIKMRNRAARWYIEFNLNGKYDTRQKIFMMTKTLKSDM